MRCGCCVFVASVMRVAEVEAADWPFALNEKAAAQSSAAKASRLNIGLPLGDGQGPPRCCALLWGIRHGALPIWCVGYGRRDWGQSALFLG